MIKIHLPNKEQVLEDYLRANKPWVQKRISFFRLLFQFINDNIPLQELKDFDLHHETKFSLARILLLANQAQQLTGYDEFTFLQNEAMVKGFYYINAVEYNNRLNTLNNDVFLERLLISESDDLPSVEAEFALDWDNFNNIKPILNKIFCYEYFRDRSAFNTTLLCNLIALNSCPYCNAVRISFENQNEEALVSNISDHFYSYSSHPLLAISFFNLVPGCTKCNTQLKRDIPFGKDTHLNPYNEGFGDDVTFKSEITVRDGNPSYKSVLEVNINEENPKYRKLVGLDADNRNQVGNINVFRIKDTYTSSFASDIASLNRKKDRMSPEYVESLGIFLDRLNAEKSDFYYDEFHAYFNEEDFQKQDLSKFKKDILRDMLAEYNLPPLL